MRRRRLKNSLIPAAMLMVNGVLAEQTPLLVDVTANYRPQGVTLLLFDGDETYFASTLDLEKWGVRGPYQDLLEYQGREYSPLSSLGDVGSGWSRPPLAMKRSFALGSTDTTAFCMPSASIRASLSWFGRKPWGPVSQEKPSMRSVRVQPPG